MLNRSYIRHTANTTRKPSLNRQTFLISPYAEKGNIYKGVNHCHSTNSDGVLTPTEVMEFWKEGGCDWASITEHIPNNHTTTTTVTTDPEVEDILFIPGIEHGYATDNHTCHHIVEQIPRPLSEIGTGEKINDLQYLNYILNYEDEDDQSEIDAAVEFGSFVVLCHPESNKREFTTEQLKTLENYHAVEVSSSEVVDIALSAGHHVGIIYAPDSHYYSGSIAEDFGRVYVFADELTIEDIIENLKACNYYTSNYYNMVLDIEIDDRDITVSTDKSSKIEFIVKDGVIKQTNNSVTSASYHAIYSDEYVRIRITRSADGKKAWSNPIWIK